ncbi:phospholipase D family protein [Crassaminicella profunda]|uniref:phospholipase D family protein n=1 Tax=Crassaminicella profunda TaxID=1286698 RepID=UPI001CA6DE9C|nr:phospholipase D family protein [Crassaminicella profunda]QZY55271.1 phospholipase D family protein [Crassaminicella profunda]
MKKRKMIGLILFLIIISTSIYGVIKPLPEGISLDGSVYKTDRIEFLYDLTYEKDGEIMKEQMIFDRVSKLIEDAEKFIIIDMFLFNDTYDKEYSYPDISSKLTNTIVRKKQKYPELKVTFVTDEMNTFYGSYPSKHLEILKKNGVNVVLTDLNQLRDSNPSYSGVWRSLIRWFKTSEKGWLPNPFSKDAPKVTFRSYLKLLNFKANHRKLIVTEKQALVSSANPHDASGYHSNIAFVVEGSIIKDIVAGEKAIGNFSAKTIDGEYAEREKQEGTIGVSFITEGKIRKNLLEAIEKTKAGDGIQIGMFYFSERNLVKALIEAANRGVNIQMILDANKDAFGMEKNGIPNRPVAHELFEKSNGKIKIRWYNTHGEQFHTKLVKIKYKDESIIFGGSANLTRRNIGDYNLEADLKIMAKNDNKIVKDVEKYFDRIWENEDGNYTLDFKEYHEESIVKNIIYRLQEWSGLSTF